MTLLQQVFAKTTTPDERSQLVADIAADAEADVSAVLNTICGLRCKEKTRTRIVRAIERVVAARAGAP